MNRFNVVRPTDINLPNIQIPLEYLNNAAQRSQQIYDTSLQVKDQNILHLNEHNTEAGQLKNDITVVADEIAKKYAEGNVEDANRYALQTLNNVSKEFKQGGRGYALGSAYTTYQQGVKDIMELNKNTPGGDINTAVALDEYAKSIKPIADNGDGLGYTHNVSANPRAYKYFNKSKALFDQIKVVDADIREQDFIGLMDRNGNLDTNKQQWISRLKEKGFDQNKIDAIFDGLTSDPAWRQQSEVEAKYTIMKLGEDGVKAGLKEKNLAQIDYQISLLDNMSGNKFKTNLSAVSGIDVSNMNGKELQQTYAQWKIDAKNKVNDEIDNTNTIDLLVDEDSKIQKHRFESLLPTEKSITFHTNDVFMDYEKMRHSDRQAAARRKFEKEQQEREWKRNDELNSPLLTPGEAVPERLNIDALSTAQEQVTNFGKDKKTFFDKLYKDQSTRIAPGPRRNAAEDNLLSAYVLAMRETDPAKQAEIFKKNLTSDNSQWIPKLFEIGPQLKELAEMTSANESAKDMVSVARNIDIPTNNLKVLYGNYAAVHKKNTGKNITFEEYQKLARSGSLESYEANEGLKSSATSTPGLQYDYRKNVPKVKINSQQEYDDVVTTYFKNNPEKFETKAVRITTVTPSDPNSPEAKALKQMNTQAESIYQNFTTLDGVKIKLSGGEQFVSVDVPADGGSASDFLILTTETPATIVGGAKERKRTRVQRPEAMKPYVDAIIDVNQTKAARAGDLDTYSTLAASRLPNPNYSFNQHVKFTGVGPNADTPMKIASGETTGRGFTVVHNGYNDQGRNIVMVRDKNDSYRIGELVEDATGNPILIEFNVSGVGDAGPTYNYAKTSNTKLYKNAYATFATVVQPQNLILTKKKKGE